jgi:purine-binding chemotaxis protein CheW
MSTPQLYCTFRVADRLFGVPIRTVREVTTETTCTRIPHAPAEVAGYVNIRGHIHLALDLRRLLGFPAGANGQHRRLVLFQAGVGTAFGVLVDEVGDIVSVDETHTEDLTPASGDLALADRGHLVTRLCKLPAELLAILDPRRFLPLVEQALATHS